MNFHYEAQPPLNFLGLPEEASAFESSAVLLLPVPYEATTSYGGGTRRGPQALIDASRSIELYDREFDGEPALEWGVHTLPALAPDLSSPEAAVATIAEAVEECAATGKLVVVLGGEHTVSVGVTEGMRRVHGEFLTVQLDAHADLRQTFEGTPLSHACAMRRVTEHAPVLQIGIRSLDVAEAAFIREHPEVVTTFFAEDVHDEPEFLSRLTEEVRGRRVFLTIDIDALDPSIMPATGTPEPGGLLWKQALGVIRTVADEAEVLGFDCVELAPIPGMHAPDFTAAKLVYKTMSYIMRRRSKNLGARNLSG